MLDYFLARYRPSLRMQWGIRLMKYVLASVRSH
jgi:hypothetical protein